jgi:hypothetical protein
LRSISGEIQWGVLRADILVIQVDVGSCFRHFERKFVSSCQGAVAIFFVFAANMLIFDLHSLGPLFPRVCRSVCPLVVAQVLSGVNFATQSVLLRKCAD